MLTVDEEAEVPADVTSPHPRHQGGEGGAQIDTCKTDAYFLRYHKAHYLCEVIVCLVAVTSNNYK